MSGILQLVNTFGPSGPFAIKNSLRFRSSVSAYLSRTITLSATWTLSVWVKRGALGATSPIFGGSVLFNSNDTLTAGTLTTTAVYRDPSAWYHIVVSNSGCYVNGVSVGSTATGILVSPRIGSNAVNYFDGYLAEINLIDGQALTPSSFGAFDATSGVWQPVKYSGTYGTNGFYLKFSDTTSTTTLCYDYSGNSNNWTPNNISLTSGSTYDSMLDSPTNYDNGGNGVGNYAVLNPLWVNPPTISNGNLNVTGPDNTAMASMGMASGKWYFETTVTTVGDISVVGICGTQPGLTNYPSTLSDGYAYLSNGNKQTNSVSTAYGSTYTSGDVIGCAFDADSGSLTFYKNGVSLGVAYSSIPIKTYYFAVYGRTSGGANNCSVNFGQRPFAYPPPTGFKALNTQNLPAASIVNGASYMAATTYTGNGSTQSISNAVNGTSFQPDFVWTKGRSSAYNNSLFDSVRGVGVELNSNLTSAEAYDATTLTAFGSGGFSVGSKTGINGSGTTFVGWNWKANGTAVSNTAGSITSQVSANTTSGFSVVTYTGTGASGTVGHGLGVAPSMIIYKSRSSVSNWTVTHTALSNMTTACVLLNTTGAQDTLSSAVPAPTSTTFGISASVAGSGSTCVAYCFAAIAGYSAFGSYTGNGSSDGPFVYCGFRPRFILIKNTTTGGAAYDWFMYDTSRDTYNTEYEFLAANYAGAETYRSNGASITTLYIDGLSNGFKIRNTDTSQNQSGSTYIYAAFAENPLKYSLAR